MVALNGLVSSFSISTVLVLEGKHEKRRSDFSGGVVE